ncbi:DUF4307 domain-containing protein [Actinocorallia sp. API 0066]|uniref:DUF4307 domain-containing protein n=1 Tax=Actinocorallia sp. API 0066 TaxID=2896846 RepID=UPI001E49B717|nr:DUF4307 domain-containing protein [Actinocorallia sp. API 0066]MCD0447873.1 DUF4307 domain-containing protein [Actinocorallia sp. API 0066]
MAQRSARTVLGYGVIGLVCLLCAAGWAVIMGNAGDSRTGIHGISAKTITYQAKSDTSTELTFQIMKPADTEVTCTARAQRTDGLVVGEEKVTVAQGKTSATLLVRLKTTERAHTAEVLDCTGS